MRQGLLDDHRSVKLPLTEGRIDEDRVNAAASNPSDNNALYERLSAPQHAGLMTRLHHATQQGELRADADHDVIANALIGTLLLKLLSSTAMDARRDSTDCASGESASTIAATLAVSRATVYRVLAKRNNETDSG